MSTAWVSTMQVPTNAKKKALVGASHPKRVLAKSGKLVRSPARERLSKKTASKNHRIVLMPRTPRNCDRGASRCSRVGQGQRGGRKGRGVERVEAQEAAEGRAGHQTEAEGGPDQAESPGSALGRGAVRYVGLGGRLGAAGGSGQHDRREEQEE